MSLRKSLVDMDVYRKLNNTFGGDINIAIHQLLFPSHNFLYALIILMYALCNHIVIMLHRLP